MQQKIDPRKQAAQVHITQQQRKDNPDDHHIDRLDAARQSHVWRYFFEPHQLQGSEAKNDGCEKVEEIGEVAEKVDDTEAQPDMNSELGGYCEER